MKVYIITAGEYSDYHIETVFSKLNEAKLFVNAKSDDYRIEEYEMDTVQTKDEERLYEVFLFPKNKQIEVNAVFDKDDYRFDKYKDVFFLDPFIFGKCFRFYVCTKSKKQAVKIVSERYSEIKANAFCYPLLFTKCVRNKEYDNPSYYPKYNYYTKEIVLNEDEEIKNVFDDIEMED